MSGVVALVGAGPGDPDLITRRGLAWLRRADVVVYDRLVAPALLAEAPAHAERVDAGKAPGRATMTQPAIEALLVAHAREGRTVVRLKGGDPGIFGRAAEELRALRAAGVAVEIVPGVTAATAAAASAGFALTDRAHTSTVLLTTGSEASGEADHDEEWRALGAIPGTLVFYMPVRRLVAIVEALREAGRAADEPAALIQAAWTPRERRLFTVLRDLARAARQLELHAPALLIVGPAVAAAPEWAATRGDAHAPAIASVLRGG